MNETELDEHLKSDSTLIAALPTEPKALAKLAKRKLVDTEPGKDELWFKVDSGAGVPEISADKHCPSCDTNSAKQPRRKMYHG